MPRKKSVSSSAKLTKSPIKTKPILGVSSNNKKNKRSDRRSFFDQFPKSRMGIEELRKKYIELYDFAPAAYLTINKKGLIVEANLAGAKLLGVKRHSLLNTPFSLFLSSEFRDLFQIHSKKVLANKNEQTCELKLIRKDGTPLYVTMKSIAAKDKKGNLTRYRSAILDITEHKQTEETLRENEKKFTELFNDAPVGYHELDMNGRITRVNQTELRMLGYSAEEMLKQPVWKFVGEKETSREAVLAKLAGKMIPSQPFERTYKRKDGTTVPVLIEDRVLRNKKGKIIGIRSILQDITRRKRIEQELHRLKEDLEKKVTERTTQLQAAIRELKKINKELEAFTYSVSHDLRSPLLLIDAFCQRLFKHYVDKLDERGRQCLRQLHEAIQRMSLLLEDLLKLSKTAKSALKVKEVNLSHLVKSITSELRETNPERRVEFLIQEGLMARGDPQLLRVTLENLLGNAWKFTGKRQLAKIEFGLTQIENEPTYFVADNGCGFDMASKDRLFKPFQRLHSAEEFPGSGIGLTTVQRIIHRHGGRIWAEGIPEKGATFFFTLPS